MGYLSLTKQKISEEIPVVDEVWEGKDLMPLSSLSKGAIFKRAIDLYHLEMLDFQEIYKIHLKVGSFTINK